MELSLEPAYTIEKLRAGAKIHKYKFYIKNNAAHREVWYQASLWKRAKRHCSVKNRLTQSVVNASPVFLDAQPGISFIYQDGGAKFLNRLQLC
jgi:hypothetical protein